MGIKKLKTIAITAAVAGSAGLGQVALAADHYAVQDSYTYEMLGNSGDPTGDSGGLMVWNHESNHGAIAVMDFGYNAFSDAYNFGVGNFNATLNLYTFCAPSGFIGACPGTPKGGAPAMTTTDIKLLEKPWSETDSTLPVTWHSGPMGEPHGPDEVLGETYVSFSLDGTERVDSYADGITGGWISIDVTGLYESMLNNNMIYTFGMTQENYDVARTDAYYIAVSQFCDSESSGGICAGAGFAPYVSIAPIPEPSTYALMLGGLGLVGLMASRRKLSK